MRIKLTKHFLILIAFSAILRLYFIYETPTSWQANKIGLQAFNDEPAHINYVKHLMRFGKLPVQNQSVTDEDAFKTFGYEYYQPPLSYQLVAYTANLLGMDPFGVNLIYLCRFIALLTGLISIYLLYFLLINLFDSKWAIILTWFYALNPVHIRHSSAFSNDIFLWVFINLLLISIILNGAKSRIYGIIEGFILGAAIYTKSSALVLLPLYVALSLTDRKHYQRWLLPIIISLFISSPYFIRNYKLYGELMGIGMSHGTVIHSLSEMSFSTWMKFFKSLIISLSFPYDTLQIPFVLKIPAYFTWIVLILMSVYKSLEKLFKERLNMINTIPEMVWLLAILAMVVYNWQVLMVEFRVIFFAFPALILILKEYTTTINEKWIYGIMFITTLYPLILVFAFA
ncbi:MAG: hypothetical protein D6830_00725 [Ignavibacteria bacterium]|nr:MAG: hypothetical protein D6830_00725 [Ignavibacteria bacterium]